VSNIISYCQGYEAAGGNPKDVWVGWVEKRS
jgi:hypothetical protein